MKKILCTALLLAVSAMTMFAQKDVTKFLGIPVDGFKPEMKSKLIAKGFTYDAKYDVFEGQFNGQEVNIFVSTNNNKVCRIMVCDNNYVSETDIKIRFNKLCSQFAKNQKYLTVQDFSIPADEDISYEMLVNHKRYESIFYQKPEAIDTLAAKQAIREKLLEKYTEEQISNPTPDIADQFDADVQIASNNYAFELLSKKPVWFMISEHYGDYYITMFYDNEYNRADGEDL